jgi:hypothetical protein
MEKDIKKELKRVDSINIYRLYWENGVHTIKLLGYIYYSDEYPDDKNYRHVEFCRYDMPVDKYKSSDNDDRDIWESEVKQYIEDCTELEAYKILKSYNATFLDVNSITDDTPDGTYIDATEPE